MDALLAAGGYLGLGADAGADFDVETVHGMADVDEEDLQAATRVHVLGAGAVGLAVTEQLFGGEQTVQKNDRIEAGAIVARVQHQGQVVVTAHDSQRDRFLLDGR